MKEGGCWSTMHICMALVHSYPIAFLVYKYGTVQNLDSGLWILYWTMDWTLDSIMASIFGLGGLKGCYSFTARMVVRTEAER